MKAERQPSVSVTTASDWLFKLSKQDQKGSAETTAEGDEGKNKKDINSLVGAIMCYYRNSTTSNFKIMAFLIPEGNGILA